MARQKSLCYTVVDSKIAEIQLIIFPKYVGIGEKKKKFEGEKCVLMTFYTDDDLQKENALCQFWDMTDKAGGKKRLLRF